MRGLPWSDGLPSAFGEPLEFRGWAEVVAPKSLSAQPPIDRSYAGVLSFGVLSHFDMAGFEATLGADLALTGPQTRVSDIQRQIHDLVGYQLLLEAADRIP